MNNEPLKNFKGLSTEAGEGGGGFAENLRSFNKDLSNETTFSLNHPDGQYLYIKKRLAQNGNQTKGDRPVDLKKGISLKTDTKLWTRNKLFQAFFMPFHFTVCIKN
jgi:hypothetical protein